MRGRVLPDGHFSLADIFSLCLRRCDCVYFHRQSTKILFNFSSCRSLHVPLAAVIGPAGHGLKYRRASGKPLVLTKKLTNMDCDEASRFISLTAIITQKTTVVYHHYYILFSYIKIGSETLIKHDNYPYKCSWDIYTIYGTKYLSI